jgi:hypothetical protein
MKCRTGERGAIASFVDLSTLVVRSPWYRTDHGRTLLLFPPPMELWTDVDHDEAFKEPTYVLSFSEDLSKK